MSACSSSPAVNSPANGANPAANSNPANANAVTATNSDPPGMQPYNGAQNLNPAAFNATNDNLKVIKVEPRKDALPYGSRTAPDNSVITSGSQGKLFLETRTFSSHEILNKVEKIMDGSSTKYKVYLKNGKVLDAPAEKMANFAAMSPSNILEIVGMLAKPAADPAEKKDQKPQ